jgi:hypothetical protein
MHVGCGVWAKGLWINVKHGGLDLSQSCLDRDSRSRQKKADLDTFEILVSTFEKSRWRSRLLNFVSTSMSRPKSLHRDREICWQISTNLAASRQILTVSIYLNNLDKNLDAAKSGCKSLDFKNLDREKKKWRSRHDGHSRRFSKVSLDTKDVLNLDIDWSWLSRAPGLIMCMAFFNCVRYIVFLYLNKVYFTESNISKSNLAHGGFASKKYSRFPELITLLIVILRIRPNFIVSTFSSIKA